MIYKVLIIFIVLLLNNIGCTKTVKDTIEPPSVDKTKSKTIKIIKDIIGKKEENKIDRFNQESIYFDYNSYDITKESRRLLINFAAKIMDTEKPIDIYGNCDSRGGSEYNMTLGLMRASSVRAFLVGYGISNKIEIYSNGEERLICNEEEESCYKLCRRCDIEIN